MILLRRLILAMIVSCVVCFSEFSEIGGQAAAQTATRSVPTATQSMPTAAHVRIDLFRGLADIFSRGMDTLTEKLNRPGYSARVYSTNGWQAVAKQIADRYSRGQRDIIVLIGHSLGADATFDIANELDRQNIPIELIVTFDATKPGLVPKNVLHFVNFYQNNGIGKRIGAGPGFQGELTNLDLTADPNIRHITIDKSARLHAYVVAKISEIVQKDLARKLQASKPKAKKSQRNR
jgi:Thioesterase domain